MHAFALLDRPYCPNPDVVANRLGDETVALSLSNGTYYGFDQIGTFVWEQLLHARSAREICAEIAGHFKLPILQVESDVSDFLADLLDHDLIRVT